MLYFCVVKTLDKTLRLFSSFITNFKATVNNRVRRTIPSLESILTNTSSSRTRLAGDFGISNHFRENKEVL